MEDVINNKIRVKVGPSGIYRTIAVKKQDLEKIKNHMLEIRKKSSVIEQSSTAPVEQITPAELLAKELIEPKIQEEVKVAPIDIPIKESIVNMESVQNKPQQEKDLDNIRKEKVLGIINIITKLQGDLDSLGEDVIKLVNLKSNSTPVIEQSVDDTPKLEQSVIEQTGLDTPVIEQPITNPVIKSVFESPTMNQPVTPDPVIEQSVDDTPKLEQSAIEQTGLDTPALEQSNNIQPASELNQSGNFVSPFSINSESKNMFDEPDQNMKLAA